MEMLRGLLVASNCMECHNTRPVRIMFTHPSSRGRFPSSGLWGRWPPGCFTTSCFPGSLLLMSCLVETFILTGLCLQLEVSWLLYWPFKGKAFCVVFRQMLSHSVKKKKKAILALTGDIDSQLSACHTIKRT